MYSVAGKNVLITGGTRGIGASISKLFADHGASVFLIYRSDIDRARNILLSLEGNGHQIYQCDITNPKALKMLMDQFSNTNGQLDILINNAGIAFHHPIDQINYQEWQDSWQQIINTNLIGPANICHLATPLLKKSDSGIIINISSRGAYRGEPLMPAYGASKAGLNAMTQSLAHYLAPEGIRVGGVAPGFVKTEMSAPRLAGETGERIKAQSPMNRVAAPEEVAEAALLMAQSNAWMTGTIWDVNGASYFR